MEPALQHTIQHVQESSRRIYDVMSPAIQAGSQIQKQLSYFNDLYTNNNLIRIAEHLANTMKLIMPSEATIKAMNSMMYPSIPYLTTHQFTAEKPYHVGSILADRNVPSWDDIEDLIEQKMATKHVPNSIETKLEIQKDEELMIFIDDWTIKYKGLEYLVLTSLQADLCRKMFEFPINQNIKTIEIEDKVYGESNKNTQENLKKLFQRVNKLFKDKLEIEPFKYGTNFVTRLA